MNAKNELVQYKHYCTKLLYKYLKDGDLASLYLELQIIEADLAKDNPRLKDASLWFRFFEHDPVVTTVGNILTDLSLPFNHRNRQYMIQNFEFAISLEGDLKVYYS